MARIAQNPTPRRGAPAPKLTRTDFVTNVGKGGKPSGGTHRTNLPQPNIPTPIERAHKRA